MVDAPSHGAGLDKVTLDSQDYYIRGPVQGQVIGEYEAGFKLGAATYDTRENAFYYVMNDFSAGFGHRRTDIHDDPHTFWDVADGGVPCPDLRRPGHLTLPIASVSTTLSPAPTGGADQSLVGRLPSHPHLQVDDLSHLLGFGGAIYRSQDGLAWTRVFDDGGAHSQCIAIVRAVATNSSGIRVYLATFAPPTYPTTQYYTCRGDNSGATWVVAPMSAPPVIDAFYWGGKILHTSTPEGDSPQLSTLFYGTTDGLTESWSAGDVADGEPIFTESFGSTRFVGVAEGPWGQPAVYFADIKNLWVLDFFSRTGYVVDIGMGKLILDAKIWSGTVIVTDGWNVFQFDPSTKQTTNIGFKIQDGVPPSLRPSSAGLMQIRALIPSDGLLYAIVSSYNLQKARLFCYNNIGWQPIGEEFSFYSYLGFQANYPVPFGSNQTWETARYIHIVSVTGTVKSYKLPNQQSVPTPGIDTFATSAAFITGWLDGGYFEVPGTLFRLFIDGWNLSATNTVKVEYQLDGAESSAWVQMVNANGAAATFDGTNTVLYYNLTTPLAGITFYRVRYKITFSGDGTSSPEVRALTMVYWKKPTPRTAWTFQIDVPRMMQEGILVGGVAATYANVWSALRTSWAKLPLLDFTVPNVQSNMRVLINKLQSRADNIATSGAGGAKPGRGLIDVTVLEPVAGS